METSASFEARSAPLLYPTTNLRDTLTRALSHRGRGAHFLVPSPGDPLLFPMQRVTGWG